MSIAIKMLVRSWISTISLLLISLILFIVIFKMEESVLLQQDKMAQLGNDVAIRCEVANTFRTKTDDLQIPSIYIDVLTSSDYTLNQYIKKICIKQTISLQEPYLGDATPRLIGITNEESTILLSPLWGGYIEYDEGYDDTVFGSNEKVCVVSARLLEYAPVDGEGNRVLSLSALLPDTYGAEENDGIVGETLRIVGTAYSIDDRTVLCPWGTFVDLLRKADALPAPESLAFYINDNSKMEEFIAESRRYFAGVSDSQEPSVYDFELIIHDEIYKKTMAIAQRDITTTLYLIRLILLFSIIVGTLGSAMITKKNMHTYAIMFTIGTSKLRIVTGALVERLLPALLGVIIGILLVSFQSSHKTGYDLSKSISSFYLCYAFGVGIQFLHMITKPDSFILSTKE